MESNTESGWQFFIDRGGTFTDVVARPPRESRLTLPLPRGVSRFADMLMLKLLSVSKHYEDAALEGIARLLSLSPSQNSVAVVKMGTTVATNALLERKGEPTLFVVAEGFRDLLLIGYQTRPDIFARNIRRAKPLYDRVIELKTRRDARGVCLQALDETQARTMLERAFRAGLRSVAVALPHACAFPQEEQRIGALARDLGYEQISLSSEVSPLIKVVSRADTTVLDAYLSPVVRGYVERLGARLCGTKLFFMQSNGGLVAKQHCRGKDAVLSGPAGGVIGMVATARRAFGTSKLRLIGFDMGGTSSDVSHYDGSFERRFETEIEGVRLRTPMLNIRTVAAGGGSVLCFDGLKLRVGPLSAGAKPGPACYGCGGPLTLTDCNLLLGRIQASHFPRLFGSSGSDRLDGTVVARKFRALAREVSMGGAKSGGAKSGEAKSGEAKRARDFLSAEEVAAGFVAIANDNMAHAIREISVERGYEVARYTLQSFGGASGQHSCAVADRLGMKRILFHPLAGLLSAYGMGEAALRALREATVSAEFGENAEAVVAAAYAPLEQAARAQVALQMLGGEVVSVVRKVRLRAEGSDSTLEVLAGSAFAMRRAYGQAYHRAFGFRAARGERLVIDSVSLEAVAEKRQGRRRSSSGGLSAHTPSAQERISLYVEGAWRCCPLYERARLRGGARIAGPALITEPSSTIVLEPSWVARLDGEGNLVATRVRSSSAKRTHAEVRTFDKKHATEREDSRGDPVLLEITGNLFRSIADQMGLTLQNTAHSVNIKERLDFSCALFDAHGNLVANAPHIPVHLGSMSDSIKAVARKHAGQMGEGDVYVLNSPYEGGTHLPDITVVRPFFDKAAKRSVVFYLAARGHHADIGGLVPGSAPPRSRHIDDEGVLLDNLLLVSGERFLDKKIRNILSSGPHPCRSVETNLADLRAQVAATTRGAHALAEAIDAFSLKHLRRYAGYVQDYGEACVRRRLASMRLKGCGKFCYRLDNGAQIVVSIALDRKKGEARIDFEGTSVQDAGNYNAPSAIVRAAVLYVFRTLLDEDIALNDGCLRPLRIKIPEGSMLSPRHPAAVVAGNTEVSQGIVDALYGALGVMASSQGTMNNVIYGNARYQNYETICGGTGAGRDHDGASGVHSHMTNTRMTDLEVLEARFPVLLESFCLRRGSGGAGERRGGDGVVRRLVFLEPSTLSLLTSKRREAPYGLEGGGSGLCGRNVVLRANGVCEELGGNAQTEMGVGDTFVMETPGGGGFGGGGVGRA